MNKAKRIAKSDAARSKRRKLKDIVCDCLQRKFNKLRKLRRAGKRSTKL
jgi:hypothetical protein